MILCKSLLYDMMLYLTYYMMLCYAESHYQISQVLYVKVFRDTMLYSV